jgi:hypothetical protein
MHLYLNSSGALFNAQVASQTMSTYDNDGFMVDVKFPDDWDPSMLVEWALTGPGIPRNGNRFYHYNRSHRIQGTKMMKAVEMTTMV